MLLADTPFLRIQADVEPILHLGQTPYGERRDIHIRGGRFEGPRLQGRLDPGVDLIQKPLNSEHLASAIRKVLDA